MKCELRWTPAHYYITSLLDKEIERLKKKGYVTNIKEREVPLVVVERTAVRRVIREVNFPDSSQIYVIQESGRIESGQLQHQFEIDIWYNRPNYPRIVLLRFRFNMNETSYDVPITELGIKRFSTTEAPMSNQDYIEAVPIALRKAMNLVIVSSEIEIK